MTLPGSKVRVCPRYRNSMSASTRRREQETPYLKITIQYILMLHGQSMHRALHVNLFHAAKKKDWPTKKCTISPQRCVQILKRAAIALHAFPKHRNILTFLRTFLRLHVSACTPNHKHVLPSTYLMPSSLSLRLSGERLLHARCIWIWDASKFGATAVAVSCERAMARKQSNSRCITIANSLSPPNIHIDLEHRWKYRLDCIVINCPNVVPR